MHKLIECDMSLFVKHGKEKKFLHFVYYKYVENIVFNFYYFSMTLSQLKLFMKFFRSKTVSLLFNKKN